MSIYEVLAITGFVVAVIVMFNQYIDTNLPKVSDVLQLMNVLPCYEVKVYKNGKRIKTSELIQHINSPVKAHVMREGILYIVIY